MKRTTITLFILLSFGSLFAQPIVVQSNSKNAISVLSQAKIDSLESPADGTVVFNSSSGCLNYFFAGKCFEVCGECTPKPHPSRLDSAIQRDNQLYLYFKTNPKNEIFVSSNLNNQWEQIKISPFVLAIPPNTSSVQFDIRTKNYCGIADTSISIAVKSASVSPLEMVKIDGKDVPTRKINNTYWMCQDYAPSSLKAPLPEQPTLLTIVNTKNVCPDGWSLPSNADWENLFANFGGQNKLLFLPPNNNNQSIGLSTNGFFNVQEKRLYATETAYYWAKDKKEDKQCLVAVSVNGAMFLAEKAEMILMSVRCIKNEK